MHKITIIGQPGPRPGDALHPKRQVVTSFSVASGCKYGENAL